MIKKRHVMYSFNVCFFLLLLYMSVYYRVINRQNVIIPNHYKYILLYSINSGSVLLLLWNLSVKNFFHKTFSGQNRDQSL